MTIADILKRTSDTLHAWAQGFGGACEVANGPAHLFALLQQKPGSLKLCVMLQAQAKRGEIEEASMSDVTFLVVAHRSSGMQLRKGDSLVERGPGVTESFFQLMEEARDVVREIDYDEDTTEFTVDFKGLTPFDWPWAEQTLDAWQMEFSLGYLMEPLMQTKGLHAVQTGTLTVEADDAAQFAPATEVYDDFNAYAAGVFTVPRSGLWLIEVGLRHTVEAGYVLVEFPGAQLYIPTVGVDGFGRNVIASTVFKAAIGDEISVTLSRGEDDGDLIIQADSYLKIHPL